MRENHAKKHMLDYKYTKNNIPITTPSLKSVYQTNAWQSNLRCMVWSLIIASRSCRWVAVNNSFISDNSLLRLKLFGIFTYDFHVVFVVSSFKLKKTSLSTLVLCYTHLHECITTWGDMSNWLSHKEIEELEFYVKKWLMCFYVQEQKSPNRKDVNKAGRKV